MTALRPVIVLRSSVQKPATSARRDSARIDRPATVGIVLAPCRTPAQQPRSSRSGGIDGRPSRPSSNGPKGLGVAQPFWSVRQWKRFLPRARTGEAVGDLERAVDHMGSLPGFGHSISRPSLNKVPSSSETIQQTFRPMILPFDDLELVYQSLRN